MKFIIDESYAMPASDFNGYRYFTKNNNYTDEHSYIIGPYIWYKACKHENISVIYEVFLNYRNMITGIDIHKLKDQWIQIKTESEQKDIIHKDLIRQIDFYLEYSFLE